MNDENQDQQQNDADQLPPAAAAPAQRYVDELEVPEISDLVEGFLDVVRDGYHQVAGHATDFDTEHFEQYAALARQKLEQLFSRNNLVQTMQTGILERAWKAVKSGESVVRRNRAAIV